MIESKQLEQARKAERYSKNQVAQLIGVSPPTYAKMERNPGEIRSKYIPKLAALFKIDEQDFF